MSSKNHLKSKSSTEIHRTLNLITKLQNLIKDITLPDYLPANQEEYNKSCLSASLSEFSMTDSHQLRLRGGGPNWMGIPWGCPYPPTPIQYPMGPSYQCYPTVTCAPSPNMPFPGSPTIVFALPPLYPEDKESREDQEDTAITEKSVCGVCSSCPNDGPNTASTQRRALPQKFNVTRKSGCPGAGTGSSKRINFREPINSFQSYQQPAGQGVAPCSNKGRRHSLPTNFGQNLNSAASAQARRRSAPPIFGTRGFPVQSLSKAEPDFPSAIKNGTCGEVQQSVYRTPGSPNFQSTPLTFREPSPPPQSKDFVSLAGEDDGGEESEGEAPCEECSHRASLQNNVQEVEADVQDEEPCEECSRRASSAGGGSGVEGELQQQEESEQEYLRRLERFQEQRRQLVMGYLTGRITCARGENEIGESTFNSYRASGKPVHDWSATSDPYASFSF